MNWKNNLEKLIEEIVKGGNNICGKCFGKNEINEINLTNFYQHNDEPGISTYAYELGDSNNLKSEHTNLTFIEFNDALKRQLLRRF